MPDLPPPPRDFASFYRATLAPLRRFLFRLTGNRTEAQDLAHDAYAKVFPAMQEKDVGQPQAFLYTTARHLALDQIKRRARSPLRPSPIESDAAASRAPGGCSGIHNRHHRFGYWSDTLPVEQRWRLNSCCYQRDLGHSKC